MLGDVKDAAKRVTRVVDEQVAPMLVETRTLVRTWTEVGALVRELVTTLRDGGDIRISIGRRDDERGPGSENARRET